MRAVCMFHFVYLGTFPKVIPSQITFIVVCWSQNWFLHRASNTTKYFALKLLSSNKVRSCQVMLIKQVLAGSYSYHLHKYAASPSIGNLITVGPNAVCASLFECNGRTYTSVEGVSRINGLINMQYVREPCPLSRLGVTRPAISLNPIWNKIRLSPTRFPFFVPVIDTSLFYALL